MTFFFCFSISRGAQAQWAPPGHAPDTNDEHSENYNQYDRLM